MNGLRDAARLLLYLAATVLLGALVAPPLFWFSRWLAAHGWFTLLLQFDFETFFHRALLISALMFVWPLFKSLRLQSRAALDLPVNAHWLRDSAAGFAIAALPLLLAETIILTLRVYTFRGSIDWREVGALTLTSLLVPLIEESLFRGLILGLLLRSCRAWAAAMATSALFAVVHFLKAPAGTSVEPTWYAGLISIGHAFEQFREPMLVLGGFSTLFTIGYILADARLRTRSLWLPIGLHAGWIFSSGLFNRMARREFVALPWLGKNLLVGIAPLCVALITWWIMRQWLARSTH